MVKRGKRRPQGFRDTNAPAGEPAGAIAATRKTIEISAKDVRAVRDEDH
jgi:hypothetical protein